MIYANLAEFRHPEGTLRFSTLPYNWTDQEGREWLGAGHVVSIAARGQESGSSGQAVQFTWSGATPDLISLALSPDVTRSPILLDVAILDDSGPNLVRVGSGGHWRGLAETPEINADPTSPTITVTAQPLTIDLGIPVVKELSPRAVQRHFPGETGADFVSGLADAEPGFDRKRSAPSNGGGSAYNFGHNFDGPSGAGGW